MTSVQLRFGWRNFIDVLYRKMNAPVLQRTAPHYRFTAVTNGKSDMKLNFGHKIEGAVISLSWQVIGMSKAIQIIMNSQSGKLP